ncbi:MAG: energy transducer TonB [Chitinophagales bacterium]|nr:energy transducer TonB [Chitinophagales bacterium]
MLELGLITAAIIVGLGAVGYAISYFFLSGGKSTDQIIEKYKGSSEANSVFVKKYEEADLSQVRGILLAFGAMVAFSTSIYALTWRDKPQQVEALVMETIEDDFEIEPPQTEQVKPPPPPPPPPEIQVVEDDEILDEEPEIEDIEIEEDEIVEVPDIIAEEVKPVEQEIFTIVEDMPKFKGCEKLNGNEATNCTNLEIQKFIAKNIVYPPMALENDIEGKVFIRFVVSPKGEVVDVSVAKGADKLLDDAALKLVKTMPQFTPGKQRGKAVPVQYIIPINFKIG